MEKQNFNEIYAKYKPIVEQYMRTRIRNAEDREELINDVFVKVAEFLEVYNCERAKISTWIFKVVNNRLTDHFRKGALAKSEEGAIVTTTADFVDSNGEEFFQFIGSGTASDVVENAELQKRIAIAFRTLKPKYRKVAIMFFLRDLKYEEIAEACNVPMGTVKGMLSRAKEMLQMELQMEYASI
jgi:RNA polymerase sigma-70 factor (ECF subfamily)